MGAPRVQPNQLDRQVLRFTSSTSFSPTTSPSLSSHKLTLFSAECNCCLVHCPVSTMHRLATAQSILRSPLFDPPTILPTNQPPTQCPPATNQMTTNPLLILTNITRANQPNITTTLTTIHSSRCTNPLPHCMTATEPQSGKSQNGTNSSRMALHSMTLF